MIEVQSIQMYVENNFKPQYDYDIKIITDEPIRFKAQTALTDIIDVKLKELGMGSLLDIQKKYYPETIV